MQKGEYTCGQEFEGKLKEGEKSWNVDADDALLKADAVDIAGDWDAASCLVSREEHDGLVECQEASIKADRLERLKELRCKARKVGAPAGVWQLSKQATTIERGLKPGDKTRMIVNAVLDRHLRLDAAKIAAKRNEARRQAKSQAVRRGHLKVVKAQLAKQQKEKEKKKKALKDALSGIPWDFSAEQCGQGKNWKSRAAKAHRLDCLNRLKLRSPPLSLAMEAVWPSRRDAYATCVAERHKEATGVEFIRKINNLLKDLGKHYGGPTKYNSAANMHEGTIDAFEKFVRHLDVWMPKSVTSARL